MPYYRFYSRDVGAALTRTTSVDATANPSDPRSIGRVIRDPVHDYVGLPLEINPLLDHPLVQRLRRVSQNSFAMHVYPAMTGTRFEHSLGVMHLAGYAWDLAWRNSSPETKAAFASDLAGAIANMEEPDPITRSLLQGNSDAPRLRDDWHSVVRLALMTCGLLHDLGHPPFSHATEPFFARHTEEIVFEGDAHVAELWRSQMDEHPNWAFHENVGMLLAQSIGAEYWEDLPRILTLRIIGSGPRDGVLYALKSIVSGEVDVDRLDYLLRDSQRAGTEFGSIDHSRLLQSIELHRDVGDGKWAVGLGVRARSAVESFLSNRLQYYRWVLHHSHVVTANRMLDEALEALLELEHGSARSKRLFSSIRPPLSIIATPRRGIAIQVTEIEDRLFSYRDELSLLAQYDSVDGAHFVAEIAAEVDDPRLIEWLRNGRNAARALDGQANVEEEERALLRRYVSLVDALVNRTPNWATLWKDEDTFADIADRVRPALMDTCDRLRGSIIHYIAKTSAETAPLRLTLDRISSLRNDLDKKSPAGLNDVGRICFHSPSAVDKRERLSYAARRMAELAPPKRGGVLAGGFWLLSYEYFQALDPTSTGAVMFRGEIPYTAWKLSPYARGLEEVDRFRPKLFATYVAPSNPAMRLGRESPAAGNLRGLFEGIFPHVVRDMLPAAFHLPADIWDY